jgi:hypothetical protein
MTILSTTVTGAPSSDLTSPTYTLARTTAPDTNGVAANVTALGGTQTDVAANSVDRPFSMLLTWPKAFKSALTSMATVAGLYPSIPTNKVTLTTRKSIGINGGGGFGIMFIQTSISVPAGAAETDPVTMAAALSCHIGELSADVTGITNILHYGTTPTP